MAFEFFSSVVFASMLLILVGGQIIIPAILGKPLFPSFRTASRKKSIAELEEELRQADEDFRRAQLEQQIQAKKAAAFNLMIDGAMDNRTPESFSKPDSKKTHKTIAD